jgi:rhodanese-related sulfurtransferase
MCTGGGGASAQRIRRRTPARAINIPIEKLAEQAPSRLDKDRPVLVYCYDALCDLSPRAAWLLDWMGFRDISNYVASKVDWIGAGLPFDGARAEGPHLATLADPNVPTCGVDEKVADIRDRLGDWELCLVLNEQRVVLGAVNADALAAEPDRPVAAVMQDAPPTYRPHVMPAEIKKQLKKSPLPWLLITKLDGTLVGAARIDDIRAATASGVGE